MADPTLWLLLPAESSPPLAEAATLLGSHSDSLRRDRTSPNEASISSTLAMGGRYAGTARPLALSLEPIPLGPFGTSALGQALGPLPAQVLQVRALCNGPEDHQVLAEVSFFLAQHFRARLVIECLKPLPNLIAASNNCILLAEPPLVPRFTYVLSPALLREWAGHGSLSLTR